MRRTAFIVVALLAAVTLLASCGGDDDAVSSVSVTATDFAFDPDVWTLKAGETFDITLINSGNEEHEWVIMKAPITEESQFTEDGVLWETEAETGESKVDTGPALEAGEYQIICGLEGHFSAGMKGSLTVTE